MFSYQFNIFLNSLLTNPSINTELHINGVKKRLRALAHLTTLHYMKENGTYYKALFTDGSFLLVLPKEEEVYYADRLLGHSKEIADSDIGIKKDIVYKNRLYRLGNTNDYQFVISILVGSPLDIEGEVRFSDYFPTEGNKAFLSLGWLVRTNKRADILCNLVNLNTITMI